MGKKESTTTTKQKSGFSGNIIFSLQSADVFVYYCGHPTSVIKKRKKFCTCVKGYIIDLQAFSVLGLTSRCSYSTVVGKDLCRLPSALFSLSSCIWLLLFHICFDIHFDTENGGRDSIIKETHVGLTITLPHQEPIYIKK